ncbi:hypothetical protein N9E24_06660 [Alphaproteobacteria bacterium]|nr:hypothetical protein [Alphaproteobacteria bacterium]
MARLIGVIDGLGTGEEVIGAKFVPVFGSGLAKNPPSLRPYLQGASPTKISIIHVCFAFV